MKSLYKYISEGYSGSGAIITYKNEVLFQLRKHPLSWAFIGGGYDKTKDKDLIDTTIRELYEEAGIIVNRSELENNIIHKLGFGRYSWLLFHVSLNTKPYINGKTEFINEYVKYKWVNINCYRKELKKGESRKYPLFFFVSHQMNLLKKSINK